MIKFGDRLPQGTVKEYIEVETPGCPVGPKEWKVEELTRGKKIVIFGLPGAFTPTCSAKHVPGYLESFNALKGKGVEFTRDIADVRWGLLTAFKMPGGAELALYEPRHPTAIAPATAASA